MKTLSLLFALILLLCVGCTASPAAPSEPPTTEPEQSEILTTPMIPEADGTYRITSLDEQCEAYVPVPEGFVVDDLSSVYCLVAMAGAGEECTSLTYMVDDLSTYDASGGMDTYISELFSFFEDTGYTPVEQNTSDTVYTVGDKEVHARTLVHAVLDDDQVFYSRVHLTYLWWMLDESHVLVCYAEETSMLEDAVYRTEAELVEQIFTTAHR